MASHTIFTDVRIASCPRHSGIAHAHRQQSRGPARLPRRRPHGKRARWPNDWVGGDVASPRRLAARRPAAGGAGTTDVPAAVRVGQRIGRLPMAGHVLHVDVDIDECDSNWCAWKLCAPTSAPRSVLSAGRAGHGPWSPADIDGSSQRTAFAALYPIIARGNFPAKSGSCCRFRACASKLLDGGDTLVDSEGCVGSFASLQLPPMHSLAPGVTQSCSNAQHRMRHTWQICTAALSECPPEAR